LLDALWAGDVVGESVLTRCVSCARKLVADDPRPCSVRMKRGERDFVGRRLESSLLREAIRQVGSNGPTFMLVAGEPGIGKSRLLEESTRHVPPGVEVHWGYCSPVEGAPPFLAWQQCLRSIARARTLKAVLRALGPDAHEARRLLLGGASSTYEHLPAWDSPSQRFRTFDAIAGGLEELARHRPLVLVLDDLHFADLGSLLLLEFLIQHPRRDLLILGSVRDAEWPLDEARSETLKRVRAACVRELVLTGLSAEEVEQFVDLKLEHRQPELARSLHARTGGNPFFLSVLTHNQEAARGLQLPNAIRQAVSHRLASLDRGCTALLRLAAAGGRDFEVAVVSAAAGMPLERAVALLETALRARLILASGARQYRFVHDLVREVLYAESGADERARAHLSLARALEAVPEYQHPRHAAMLAHHYAQGAELGGGTRALDLSIRAGAFALRNFAYEEAIEQFSRAARLLALDADLDPTSECAVLLDLGIAQVSAGQREAGQATLRLAAAKARELGAAPELASVALSLSPGLFAIEVGTFDVSLVGLLREALALVGTQNDRLRALLLARLALALYWGDTFADRQAICSEATALAASVGSDEVSAAVLTAHALSLSRPSNLHERLLLTERAVDLCGRVSDHHGSLLNRLHRASILLELGDGAANEFEADLFRKLAEEVKQPQALWIGRALQACRLLLDGRLSEVEALAADCLQTGQRVQDHNALQTFGVHLTLVRLEQGRGAELTETLRTYATTYPRTVAWRAMYLMALHRSGQHEACAAEYASAKAKGFALPDDLLWQVSMAFFAEISSARGDREAASVLYERLAPHGSRCVVIGFGIACLGSMERYLGLLAAAMGEIDMAREHYERAIATNRQIRGSLPLAHSLYELASLPTVTPEQHARRRTYWMEAKQLAEARQLTSLLQKLSSDP
jgi:hypothetical protein